MRLDWLVELDRILRGETTRVADLQTGTLRFPLFGVAFVVVVLAMLYGVCMGVYATLNHARPEQMLASTVKVPALFFLTLAITLPSLYVFNALVGSRLTLPSLVRLFVASLGVNIAVLSSLGPIVAFFSVNTTSYNFMVLLNVVVFAVSGFLSLGYLVQTLHRLNTARVPRAAIPVTPAGAPSDESEPIAAELADPGPLERIGSLGLGARVKGIFFLWMIVFGLVGAQMGWVMRPFVGSPDEPFTWFRPRESNFFEATWQVVQSLFGM